MKQRLKTIGKINATRSCFFSKIKLVNLSRLLKKMERAQIHKIRDDEVTTSTREMQKIIRDYYYMMINLTT